MHENKIYDNLGRVKVLKSNDKTIVYKYWDNTNLLKIVYHLIGDVKNPRHIEIDVLNKQGNFIMSYSNVLGMNIKIKNFRGFNSMKSYNIEFEVSKEKMKLWAEKLNI